MIHFPRRVFQASPNVFILKVGIVSEDFAFTHASGQQVKHILYTNTHASNTRPPSTLAWIKSDPVCVLHNAQYISLGEFFQVIKKR